MCELLRPHTCAYCTNLAADGGVSWVWGEAGRQADSEAGPCSCSHSNSAQLWARTSSPSQRHLLPSRCHHFLEKARSAEHRRLKLQFRHESWHSLSSKGHSKSGLSENHRRNNLLFPELPNFISDHMQTYRPYHPESAQDRSIFSVSETVSRSQTWTQSPMSPWHSAQLLALTKLALAGTFASAPFARL